MLLVHGDRSKPALKKVASPAPACVGEVGLAPMRFSDGQSEDIRPSARVARRTENQVNMIRPEAIGPHLDPRLARVLGQQIPLNAKCPNVPKVPKVRKVLLPSGA
jgi:hypothetical protein